MNNIWYTESGRNSIEVFLNLSTLPLTLTFNPMRATVMTYSHAEVQGQRSVGSKDGVEADGRTDRRTDGGGDCITCRINAVGKYS